MKKSLQQFFLTFAIYLCACICTVIFVTPYSFTSFIGPAAGITTALVIAFGTSAFLGITVATISFCFYLSISLSLQIELSMVIIVLLAILLQGYWAKQLTLKETNKQNWLRSRQHLLLFLFKIGPIISLVAAFAVLVVVILESKTLDNNLFFTFVSGWSGSVLFSIFITPILLLTQGSQQLNLPKRIFIIISSILAFIAIGLLFKLSQNFQQHERFDAFTQVQSRILQGIRKEIDITISELNSLSAFMQANENVNSKNFKVFAKQIFQANSSIRALEWAPIVHHKNREGFEIKYNNILEKGLTGGIHKAQSRTHYAPIRYVYPYQSNEPIIGLDVLTNSKHIISMDEVVSSKQIIASAPINLIQEEHAGIGIFFVAAVYSDSQERLANVKAEESENLLGFVIAVVQLNEFFQYITSSQAVKIDLFIEDITSEAPFILFGHQIDNSYRHVESTELHVNSRQWKISLAEQKPWQLQQKNWYMWGILFGSTLGGILFQLFILMMAVYSNELNAQIVRKTRELIIANEQSEQKNVAKTNFLHALSEELQTPLAAIKGFCQQLSKADKQQESKIINNIELAQDNMEKLLRLVSDSSAFESEELNINNKLFDFYSFMGRIENMLLAKQSSTDMTSQSERSISFVIHSEVPNFIHSDELKIQRLLIALCESTFELFNSKKMKLTVKVHNHHLGKATLLFIFTHDEIDATNEIAPFDHFLNGKIDLFNMQMALAKKVSQTMKGDINLAISESGERVLTASINISISVDELQ